jgi:enoyl-CoA hydratase/carnithine racemase
MAGARDLPTTVRRGRTEPAVPVGPDSVLDVAGGVAVAVLARPERGNALSATMVEALLGAVSRASSDPSVHTLVLAAAGRHFCTGLDLGGLDEATEGDLLLRLVRIETLLDAVWRAPVRTVCIANGRAWGAGADLFAAGDLRLAGPDCTFRFPGAGFGLVLGTRRLAERVGTERARAWVLEGRTLDAGQAVAAGLATCVPDALADARPDAGSAADRITAARSLAGDLPVVDRATLAAIRAASRPAGGPGGDALADADLAALVRSATRPGLKARLLAYRDRARAVAVGRAAEAQ